MEIIERLQQIMNSKGLSYRSLCILLDISESTMSSWRSRKTNPPANHLVKICEFMGVSMQYLLTGDEETSNVVFPKQISQEDTSMIHLFHQLPLENQIEIRGEIKGMLRGLQLQQESIAHVSDR